ncbi:MULTISPECIES: hypothetical protein [Paraburkholderia]|uniref:hypothetical protein n=1 Tax=Paraburkholderia TaxID=1822464 RepID=UPI0038B97BEE
MQDDISKLYKLATPYFPALGEVFVAISAGDYRGRGFPMYFGEFFIFSTKDINGATGRRSHVPQHHAALDRGRTGIGFLFEITKIRACDELSGQIVSRLGLDGNAQFAHVPSLTESSWDDVQDVYRAGLIEEKVLLDIGSRTRAGIVHHAIHTIRQQQRVSFEDAKASD